MAVAEYLNSSESPRTARSEAASASAGAVPVRFGLATRMAFWAILFGTITAAAVAYVMYQGAVSALVDREIESLSASANSAAVRLSIRIDGARRDVAFLANVLPVTGIVDAASASDPAARNRLAGILDALLRSRPAYLEARLIGVADGGREVVRVDRFQDGIVRRTPDAELQRKGERPFFVDAVALAPGDVLVTDFELNQDNGAIVVPYRPVLRTAMPVFDSAGRVFGALVINADARQWFELLKETAGAGEQLSIVNAGGDYLLNPDPTRTFGFELGTPYRLADDMPTLAAELGEPGRGAGATIAAGDGGLAAARRVEIDPSRPDRHVTVIAAVSDARLLGSIQSQRQEIVLVALGLIVIGAIFAVLFARAVVRPIRALTVASLKVADGEPGGDFGQLTRRSDETGALARAFATMTRRVADRERELTARTAELTRSNEELSQFAYIASHDLQEPLRMVGSYLGLIARRYRGQLDADADEFIGYAVDGASRMKRLINDLLGYSRVSNRPLSPESVDTRRVVGDVLRVLAGRIEAAGADIVVGTLPPVEADAGQVEQLFLNLVENAIKYRRELPPRIVIEAEAAGDVVAFSVADNGIGIDPRFREKVFEIFTRLHGRDKYEGTGIGLASCRKIVERHGGRITVEDAPGGGSIFRFTLPAGAQSRSLAA